MGEGVARESERSKIIQPLIQRLANGRAILTLLGALLPQLLAGSVIIEYIFSIPGMGRLAFEAILSRDYPLIMGIVSISALMTLIGLIISDVLYAVTDPRIRLK